MPNSNAVTSGLTDWVTTIGNVFTTVWTTVNPPKTGGVKPPVQAAPSPAAMQPQQNWLLWGALAALGIAVALPYVRR